MAGTRSLSSLSVSLYRLIRTLHLCLVGKQVKDEIQLWILRFIFDFVIHRVFDLGDNVVHQKLLGNVKIHGERSKSKCYLCFWWPSDSGKAYDVLSLLKEVEIKLSSRLSCTDWNEFCDMLKPVNYCTILYTCLSLGRSQGLLFHIDPVNLSCENYTVSYEEIVHINISCDYIYRNLCVELKHEENFIY